MYVNLKKLPDPPQEYAVKLEKLDGGLNLSELPYRLKNNESPDMLNLWWREGALCCRDGQVRLTVGEGLGEGLSCCPSTFWGRGFFHIGSWLFYGQLSDPEAEEGSLVLTVLLGGVPEAAGTWFFYGEKLYYKCPGGYYAISYDRATDSFAAGNVEAYAPIIQINSEPDYGSGDSYQPENRISPVKTVWYSAVDGVTVYHLPVQEIDSVDKVIVDGVELSAGTGYTVDLTAGTVTFATAPPEHQPVEVNTVRITYSKENAGAMSSIMECGAAAVYGGDQNVCVVVGGPPAQPNAYFWSGNHAAMDPGYFPVEQYNLAGSSDEHITGFGKQQDFLVIFKEQSIGRADFAATEMGSGRVLLSMDYTAINAAIGCDLPGSIQLIENNLVFANTKQGVHIILDSSAAYENNILCISGKVNGEAGAGTGLMGLLAQAGAVCSRDDDSRYWLVKNGEVYCWDYAVSSYKDPSWFYFDAIPAIGFLRGEDGTGYHLDGQGRVSILRRNWMDYGEAITKRLRFAVQHLGGYDRLKDVTRCVFTVRGDTDSRIKILYDTDYEKRYDLTDIKAYSFRLAPFNLSYLYLALQRYATVAVRKPNCRHIRHFGMELSNNSIGQDMAILSAEFYYRYQGRDR